MSEARNVAEIRALPPKRGKRRPAWLTTSNYTTALAGALPVTARSGDFGFTLNCFASA
jgi:hypothetical protein